jgi:hypothetical protein
MSTQPAMTNEEIIQLADLVLRVEKGEVEMDQQTLDAETKKLASAEDWMAFNLAHKILSGRPFAVLSDNPILEARARTMGEYLHAEISFRQFDIGKDEIIGMYVFYPRPFHLRPTGGPALRLVPR